MISAILRWVIQMKRQVANQKVASVLLSIGMEEKLVACMTDLNEEGAAQIKERKEEKFSYSEPPDLGSMTWWQPFVRKKVPYPSKKQFLNNKRKRQFAFS